ncbi:MAG: ABC transporter permease, partial [Clostridia bacterium]|nr:ABC transporter permease [Clostridia bacterium]
MEETTRIEENEAVSLTETAEVKNSADTEVPLDKNIKLMSPGRMVLRRFFRSKLSIVGLIMIIGLFVFSFLGPVFYTQWGEIQVDESQPTKYSTSDFEITVSDMNGETIHINQTIETTEDFNGLAPMSWEHPLGTDKQGYDVFVRLMYGGRISLIVSFLSVFVITVLGVIMGGIAGYFGGAIDNIIMRVCDILMCLPGVPILLIISLILDSADVDAKYRIYLLMIYLTLFSWPGTAR